VIDRGQGTKGAGRNRTVQQAKGCVELRVILRAKRANWSQRATSLPGNLCSVPEHHTGVRVMGCSGEARMRGTGSQKQGRGQGADALDVAVGWWLYPQQVLSRCWRR
jgi:hypothetical protein